MYGYALGISCVFEKKRVCLRNSHTLMVSWWPRVNFVNNFNYANNWQTLRGLMSPERAIKQNNACLCCFLRDTLDQETFFRWTPTVEEKTSMILIHSFFRKKISSNAFFWRKSPYGDGTSTAIQHWWPIFMMVSGREGHLKAQHISWRAKSQAIRWLFFSRTTLSLFVYFNWRWA